MTTIVPKELQINKFKVNHWYIYIGTKPMKGWIPYMGQVLDHEPVKCTYSNEGEAAEFNTILGSWEWGDLADWIEVEELTSKYDRCGIGEYYYDHSRNSIAKNNSGSAIFCGGAPYYAIIRQSSKEVDGVPSNKVHYSDIKLPIIITDIVCTGEVLETLNKSFKLTINLTRNVKCLYVKPHYDYDYSPYEYKDSGFSKMLIYEDIPTIKYSDIDFGFKIIEVDMSGMKTKVLKQRIGTTEFEVGKQYRMKTKEELIAMGYKEVDGGLRYSPHYINKIMITLCGSLITIKSLSNAPVYNCSIIQSENSWHTDWFHLHDPQQKSFSSGSIKKKSKYISITKTKIESKEYKTHKPKYIKLTKSKQGFKLPESYKLPSGVDLRCI